MKHAVPETIHDQTSLSRDIKQSIDSAARRSVNEQRPDGHWVGSVESNACMEAQWCLGLWILGLDHHPIRKRLGSALLRTQRSDGSWQIYYGAPNGDINATVEAYAALRSLGFAADDERLRRARRWILDKGGLRSVRVFTRYWLALIGEWPWEKTPNLPPEIVWLPTWFPFSIYNFAQWARATMMPLTIICAQRPSRPLPSDRRLDELFPDGRFAFNYDLPPKPGAGIWDRTFRAIDRILHRLQKVGFPPARMRRAAVRDVLCWMLAHQDSDGGWGGIQPPWLYGLIALHVEDYGHDHPAMAKGLACLDDPGWRIDQDDATWIQATNSPVWDTMLTLMAFEDAGCTRLYPEATHDAARWLLDRQIRSPGDWSVKLPDVMPGGWAFEYANDYYPDVDDTAVALIALAPFRTDARWRARGIQAALARAVDWLRAMQCDGGGWAAFDRNNDRAILTKIPFCDFGEALDPPSVDVTAHVIEAFAKLGVARDDEAIRKAIAFVYVQQEPDGPWFGRWGVNYIYGTGAVLPALAAIGEDMSRPEIQKACDWLIDRQQPSGGWGESCASYIQPELAGIGEATASQTAWALMALIAANRPSDRYAIELGCMFLIERQRNGTWDEPEFTGTGFPGYGVGQSIKLDDLKLGRKLGQGAELSRGFMLRYDLYRHYFPLMALGRASCLSNPPTGT